MRQKISIVVPVFNDWVAFRSLLADLSAVSAGTQFDVVVVAVDDGSTEGIAVKSELQQDSPLPLVMLTLARNLGHPRAIAIGLCHTVASRYSDQIVVMDSDGEDRPTDIPRLLECLKQNEASIVVASRSKRSEGLTFRFFYQVFKFIFLTLTNKKIDFGNFSAMRSGEAERIASMYEVLLHYPAALLASGVNIIRVTASRGERYAGQSKLGFLGLAVHGLSAIAAFSDRVLVRMLLGCVAIFCTGVLAIVIAIILKVIGQASPGWVTTVVGSVLAVLVEVTVATVAGLLVVLYSKQSQIALPSEITTKFIKTIDYSVEFERRSKLSVV